MAKVKFEAVVKQVAVLEVVEGDTIYTKEQFLEEVRSILGHDGDEVITEVISLTCDGVEVG